jgi:hypothetical protein
MNFNSQFIALFIVLYTCALTNSVHAQCIAKPNDRSFENQRTNNIALPWQLEGRGGIDGADKKLAQSGLKNVWLRHNQGWNAIRQQVSLSAGEPYTLKMYVRTSVNMHNGYVGFRDKRQKVVSEVKIDAQLQYTVITVKYTPTISDTYFIFGGFWATEGDTWMQIDNVELLYPCRDTE